jgi:hypothetical protein
LNIKLTYKLAFFFIASFTIIACIEPFDTNFNIDLRLIVVEGTLSDLEEETFVSLKEAIPSGGNSSVFRVIKNAKVSVFENETSRIDFTETEDGFFSPPSGFKGKVGATYSLEFTTAEGNSYKSKPDVLNEVAPIERIHQTSEKQGSVVNGNTVPANIIYIDAKDPVGLGNNYMWSWTLYERQYACVTCEGGLYYTDPLPAGKCVDNDQLKRRNVVYDYICDSPCWQIFRSDDVNTQSDIFVDGLTIQNREIARIPYYNDKGGLIEIKQQSISRDGYTYLKLLVEQGQNTGGLADTPPAALEGNVKSLNKDEVVSGFFLVSGMKKHRYWIDRSDMAERGFRQLGLLGGRSINQEPLPIFPSDRPPLAPCLNGRYRTNSKPFGFLFD